MMGSLEDSRRSKFNSHTGTLNNILEQGIISVNLEGERMNNIKSKNPSHVHNMQNDTNLPLQNLTEKLILFGADVVGLYPNLHPIGVARIAAEYVRKTKVTFTVIDFSGWRYILHWFWALVPWPVTVHSEEEEFKQLKLAEQYG